MLVKMRRDATADEIATVEHKLHDLGFKTGKLEGVEITLVGVYGDISKLPQGEIAELAGVEQLIPISRAYKRVAQKGTPGHPIYQTVTIGNVVCGGDDLVFISGPCSVESERQIMDAARMVKEAGCQALRGGVVKYRSSPYSGWEGLGASDAEALRNGLELIVRAGREFEPADGGRDPRSRRRRALRGRGRRLPPDRRAEQQEPGVAQPPARRPRLPVIHKRGNSLDTEAYLLWVERMMVARQGEHHPVRARHRERQPLHAQHARRRLDRGVPLPAVVPAGRGRCVARHRRARPGPSRDARRHHGRRLGRAGRGASESAHRQVGRSPGALRGAARRRSCAPRRRPGVCRGRSTGATCASADLEKGYLARMDADKRRFFRT